MSIKPKYSSTDSNAAELCETTFFMWDVKGEVAVAMTKPPQGVAGPVQILRITGPSAVPVPNSPMTDEEFVVWRRSLDAHAGRNKKSEAGNRLLF